MASWRNGTSKQFRTYLARRGLFCKATGIDHCNAFVGNGVAVLASLYHKGTGYSAINTARSALFMFIHTSDHTTFGTHPQVVRLLIGVIEHKPSCPRYSHIWDVGDDLKYLKSLGPATRLDLRTLSRKRTTLFGLLTGQRCRYSTFFQLGKNQKPRNLVNTMTRYTLKPTLRTTTCVSCHIQKKTLMRIATLWGEYSKLQIIFIKPHRSVCSTAVS